jgi:copper chaperone CopZ
MSPYLHVMEGRLRVKVHETKRSLSQAQEVEQVLRSLAGITHAAANPTTGNVLVLFDSDQLTHDDILSALRKAGYLREQPSHGTLSLQLTARVVDTVSHAVARSVAEALMERAILALL